MDAQSSARGLEPSPWLGVAYQLVATGFISFAVVVRAISVQSHHNAANARWRTGQWQHTRLRMYRILCILKPVGLSPCCHKYKQKCSQEDSGVALYQGQLFLPALNVLFLMRHGPLTISSYSFFTVPIIKRSYIALDSSLECPPPAGFMCYLHY